MYILLDNRVLYGQLATVTSKQNQNVYILLDNKVLYGQHTITSQREAKCVSLTRELGLVSLFLDKVAFFKQTLKILIDFKRLSD